jgi:hypothetical protein
LSLKAVSGCPLFRDEPPFLPGKLAQDRNLGTGGELYVEASGARLRKLRISVD